MFSTVVGSIFIVVGVVFLLYPEGLRRRLRRKAIWKLRRYLFGAAFFVGVLLVSAGWRQPGLLPKVLMVLGVVALLKGLLLLNAKATEHVTVWILERPILQLRIVAAGQVVLGFLILLGLRS